MRSRTRTLAVLLAVSAAVALVAAGCGGGGGGGSSTTTTSAASKFKAALISDIAGFNDNGFNKNQLAGLNNSASSLGITPISKVSHSSRYPSLPSSALLCLARDDAQHLVGGA